MRKRTSRPRRFAAVDNEAIDALGSLLAVGLLTRLIRAQDGDDVTVESLARDYDEGESALGKAMRMLVDKALVIKFKIQRQATETVEDADGRKVQKRGGSWWTTFSVDSIPFTQADAAAMLADIFAGGNVRAVRVEPEWLDPRKAATDHPGGGTRRSTRPTRPAPSTPDRPTPQNAGVGPTWGNVDSEPPVDNENPENSGPRPTPPKPRAGRPSAGQGGALFKEETVVEDSLCGAAGTRVTGEEPGTRETATAHPSYDTAGTPLGARQTAREAPEVPEGPAGSSAAPTILPSETATEAATFAAALPGRLGPESVRMLVPLVARAFGEGWTSRNLRDLLVQRVDVTRVYAADSVYAKHLKSLPAAPQRTGVPGQRPTTTGGAGLEAAACPKHSWALVGDCAPCRAADRGRTEPAALSDDVRELLASLRLTR